MDSLPPEIILQIAEEVERQGNLPQFMKAYPRVKEVVRQMGRLDLPKDMLNEIISYLPEKDLINLGQSSSSMYTLTRPKRIEKVRNELKIMNEKLDQLPQVTTESLDDEYLSPFIKLIKKNFYLWSDPLLKRDGIDFLNKFQNKMKMNKHLHYYNYKGTVKSLNAIRDFIYSIQPKQNETDLNKFLNKLELYRRKFDKIIDRYELDEYDDKLIYELSDNIKDVINLIYSNINHMKHPLVQEFLSDIQDSLYEYEDFGGDGIQSTPTFEGYIEKLQLLMDLRRYRLVSNYAWTY
jgi:hypothetical protein